MLQAPFPVNAARAGDLRAVTAWRQRCATTEANPVDARFPFDEWRPLQLACAEGDAADHCWQPARREEPASDGGTLDDELRRRLGVG